MSIRVQNLPGRGQTILRPDLSLFTKGVNLDDVLRFLPADKRPSANYSQPRVLAKLDIFRCYVSKDNDVYESLSLSCIKRNKTVWIARSDARRILQQSIEDATVDEILPDDGSDECDGKVFPERIGHGVDDIANTSTHMEQPPVASTSANLKELPIIALTDDECLVRLDGQHANIMVCGERTYEEIRFSLNDIFRECEYNNKNSAVLSGIVIDYASVENENIRVVDFRNAVRLFSHFDRQGSPFAVNVMDWCSRVIFNVQHGSSDAIPDKMGAYMRKVAGRMCSNPMAECTSKMVYFEVLGDVASLCESWPELGAFVSSSEDAETFKVVKFGEGSGHRFGSNARRISSVHPDIEPSVYNFRPTMLDAKGRKAVERALAEEFSLNIVPPNTSKRFTGDTEILVLSDAELARAWRFVEREVSLHEKDLDDAIGNNQVKDLEHKLELADLKTENQRLQATIERMQAKIDHTNVAIQILPAAARKRFHSVMGTTRTEN